MTKTMTPVFKQSTFNDFDFLYSTNKAAIKENMVRAFGQWKEEEQSQYFKNSTVFSENFIIEYDKMNIGFITIKELKNRTHIDKFCILPEFQNKGLGAKVLNKIIKDLKPQRKVTLQVFYNNPCISLYLRHGFVEYKRNQNYVYLQYLNQ